MQEFIDFFHSTHGELFTVFFILVGISCGCPYVRQVPRSDLTHDWAPSLDLVQPLILTPPKDRGWRKASCFYPSWPSHAQGTMTRLSALTTSRLGYVSSLNWFHFLKRAKPTIVCSIDSDNNNTLPIAISPCFYLCPAKGDTTKRGLLNNFRVNISF